MEADHQFGPNIVIFQLASGERQWYIVGCYLAPQNTLTVESLIATLKERPRGSTLLVVGDSNKNQLEPEGNQGGKDIVAALVTEGLEDMSA